MSQELTLPPHTAWLVPLLFQMFRLLAVVPAVFGTLWNLYHEYGALDFADPSSVLGYEEGPLVDKVDVINPYYDYVGPELVDVFITNE